MRDVAMRVAAIGALVVLASGSSPTSALAERSAVLSAGSSLFAVSCDNRGPDSQFLSIDSATADATPIGTGSTVAGDRCGGQAAWDASTQTAYYLGFGDPDTLQVPSALVSIDSATGATEKVGDITKDGANVDLESIAIGIDGAGYALFEGELYSLNLATAALRSIGPSGPNIFGFAVHPTSGTFYTIDWFGLISTIDVTTGTLTTVGRAPLTPAADTFSLQIDRDGTLWIESDTYPDAAPSESHLWSISLADIRGSAVHSGAINVDGQKRYAQSLLLIPGALPPPVAPVIQPATPSGAISLGAAFSYTVAASGTAPVTFLVSSGALPSGLALDRMSGIISGTPTTIGSFTFTITATNAGGTTAATFTRTVVSAVEFGLGPTRPVPGPGSKDIHLPIVTG